MNKLIKIKENYYVIDDSDIKEDDYYLVLEEGEYVLYNLVSETNGKNPLKITHSTQEGIGEQFNLNDIEELVNGYSVENLAESSNGYALYGKPLGEKYLTFKEGFLSGFKAHKELSKDKLFTIEDMQLLAAELIGRYRLGEIKEVEDVEKIINSRLPKTEWNIEFQNGKIVLV